jgi:hypothetical protein
LLTEASVSWSSVDTLYLEWHLRQAWSELVFDDEHPARGARPGWPWPPGPRRPSAKRRPNTTDGLACQSFRDLVSTLAPRTRNTIRVVGTTATFDKLAEPAAVQRRALELLERRSHHRDRTDTPIPPPKRSVSFQAPGPSG